VLRIMGETRDIDLKLSSVECKFTRRQHDNLQSKCQALSSMLQAGIHPQIAIATSGLFNDPMDVYRQSKEYLVKWDPVQMVPGGEEETVDEEGAQETGGGEPSRGRGKGYCKICGKKLPRGRSKYCSDNCLQEANLQKQSGGTARVN